MKRVFAPEDNVKLKWDSPRHIDLRHVSCVIRPFTSKQIEMSQIRKR